MEQLLDSRHSVITVIVPQLSDAVVWVTSPWNCARSKREIFQEVCFLEQGVLVLFGMVQGFVNGDHVITVMASEYLLFQNLYP